MTTIKTVSDLNKWQQEQIAVAKAADTYTLETLEQIATERDAMVVSETIGCTDQMGDYHYKTVTGNARERRGALDSLRSYCAKH